MNEAIPHAYGHAAGRFHYTTSRGMWYVVVAYVRSHHDYPILPRSYQYFAYTVLRQYLQEDHADKTRDWTVLSNARRGDRPAVREARDRDVDRGRDAGHCVVV